MPGAAYQQFGPNCLPLMADINSDRTRKRRRDKSAAMKDPPDANLELKQLHLECINNVGRKWRIQLLVLILISNSKDYINSISQQKRRYSKSARQCSERMLLLAFADQIQTR